MKKTNFWISHMESTPKRNRTIRKMIVIDDEEEVPPTFKAAKDIRARYGNSQITDLLDNVSLLDDEGARFAVEYTGVDHTPNRRYKNPPYHRM